MNQRSSTLLFSVTIFLSAGLLFAVQPMLGKMMLPLVGGSPSGWLTALAFFQLALLAGYLLAHWFSKFSARGQAWGTVAVLLFGTLLLPPNFTVAEGANIGNVEQVLWLLFRAIFVPYLGLATVSSGLQRLYAARQGGADPYFLYAASNAGSFVGLLAYPLIVEPLLPLSSQRILWTVGYGLLLILIALLAGPKLQATQSAPTPTQQTATAASQISWRQRGSWVLLAFIPSSLSMGLTALVTADLGSFPLLWVIPLGLYLLTFVIAFADKQIVSADRLAKLQLVAFVPLLIVFLGNNGSYAPSWGYTFIPLAAFFTGALWCHVRLAQARPAVENLTEYYLLMSVGGALGGCFNAFAAPVLFSYPIEFMLTAILALLLQRPRLSLTVPLWAGAAMALLFFVSALAYQLKLADTTFAMLSIIGLLSLPIALASFPRLLAVAGFALVIVMQTPLIAHDRIAQERNFFGVVTVVDQKNEQGDIWRFYVNGSGIHGAEMTNEKEQGAKRNILFMNPMRQLVEAKNLADVGVLGVGPAMAACLSSGQKHTTFYEIDPLARKAAEQYFSYIKECGTPVWHMGDGRLELEKDKSARFDLLIVDAFTAGSIPIHLVTQEAIDVYLSRLNNGGIIAFNINNLYYDLSRPLATLAANRGLQAWEYHSIEPSDLLHGKAAANWMILSAKRVDLELLRTLGWKPSAMTQGFPLWTDDLTNALAALKFIQSDGGHAAAE